MNGILVLENFINEKANELEVIAEVLTACVIPDKVCAPEDYFEMITMCKLCGKLC